MDARVDWREQECGLDPKVAARWSTFGPYYAMFPVDFARQVIARHTEPGDFVLDPFCGRGTTVFCAGETGRDGLGVEINPVGWLYARVKIGPAPLEQVVARLKALGKAAKASDPEIAELPRFFRMCFCPAVLSFLLACRRELNWRTNRVDATLMAFVILYLHGRINAGDRPQALSNQMRQTKAMWPQYSIQWWKDNGFTKPPVIDPVPFLEERLRWRYKMGSPALSESVVRFGDARSVLPHLPENLNGTFKLLLTSPPYSSVTSYYQDQWLRMWMLGDSAVPSRTGGRWKGRFEHREDYRAMIEAVFERSARFMAPDAVIYVRTDAREFTLEVTITALDKAFPGKKRTVKARPFTKNTQTALFGDAAEKPGEMDIILK